MYDVPRRKKLRDRCAEPWKRKGAAVSGGVPPFPGFRSGRRAHRAAWSLSLPSNFAGRGRKERAPFEHAGGTFPWQFLNLDFSMASIIIDFSMASIRLFHGVD